MRPRALFPLAPVFSLFLWAFAAAPVGAQDRELSGSTLYRLDAGTTYQTGCFEPCLCPILVETPVRGTLVLTPDGVEGAFSRFKVSDVNWTVSLGDPELRVTGSGVYLAGGDSGAEQRLLLDLVVGDLPVERYDSGFVKGADLPAIQVTVSIHGMYCYDTVFALSASPVPLREIVPYRTERDSTFTRGCVGLCDCLQGEPLPLSGSFQLVPLERNWLFSEYAVVNVRWAVETDGGLAGDDLPVQGFGTYWVGGEVAVRQRMRLDLKVGSDPLAPYDSGLLSGGAAFPRIDVSVANGDPLCFQTVIDLRARPRLHRRLVGGQR